MHADNPTASPRLTTPSSLPTAKATSSTRRTSSRLREILDSDDSDESSMSLQRSNGVFQGVIIPKANASMSKQRQSLGRRNPSSSIADSMESSDYETPATSTIPTPTDTSKS